MPDIRKLFYDKPIIILTVLFLVLSCIDIIYATAVKRAIIYDGSIWFSDIVSNQNSFNFEMFWGVRTRGFVNFINTLPVNIAAVLLHVKSKTILALIFSLPFFLNNFLLLIFHYFLTLRTKRIDIFLSALFLHCSIIIPLNMYAIVEISLATSILMLLFHYLCANIEYKKTDIFFIAILTAISYLSTEATVYCGILLFIFALKLAKKQDNKKSRAIKLFIGINCLLISLFQLYLFHHFSLDYINETRADLELSFFKDALKSYYFKIDIFFSSLLALAILNKNRFKNFFILTLTAICVSFFVYTVITGDYVSSGFFEKRFIPCILLPLLFIVNTLFPPTNSERFETITYNILLLVLIWGCLNLLFSVNNSYVFEKTVKTLVSATENSTETFIDPDKDLANIYEKGSAGSYLFNCDTYTYDGLNFSRERNITKIILPSKQNGCPDTFGFTETELVLPFSSIPIKSDYADLSKIKEEFTE